MKECKFCGREFHACASCGLTYDWEWKYCCRTCWENSDEYKEQKERFNRASEIIDSLSPEQCRIIYSILDTPDLFDEFMDKILTVSERD